MSPSDDDRQRLDLERHRKIQDAMRDGHLDRAIRYISPAASLHYLQCRDAAASQPDHTASDARAERAVFQRELISRITACRALPLVDKLRMRAAAEAVDIRQPGAVLPLVEISRELEPYL